MTNVLQNFIYPSNQTLGSKEKYLRVEGNVYFGGNTLEMTKFANVQFDTYYNAFSIPLWRENVGLADTQLTMAGSGTVDVELWHLSNRNIKEFKQSVTIELTEDRQVVYDLDITNPFAYSGLVYIKIVAKRDVEVTAIAWQTRTAYRRDAKLGISVTHFNRKAYVLPAIKRIKDGLLDVAEWQEKIDFIVVDNSKNITEEEAMGVTIIPNENTGGSGGFTRGFLYYKNDTDATHVLFMDDDASLEIESIKRAYQILSFAEKANTAVGAALFYEDRPDMLIERGAQLDAKATWLAKFRDTDATRAGDVLGQELDEEKNEYFGWWFNAFPIEYTDHLTLPYFVRGDDVSFGVLNKFHMVMGNGIAAIAENFDYKVAAMTEYLDLRNKLLVNSLFINRPSRMVMYYWKLVLESVLAGRYGFTKVYNMALRDFIHMSPEQMVKNANMQDNMAKIKQISAENALHEIDLADYDLVRTNSLAEDSKVTIWRRITLNKLFFPLRNDKIIFQPYMRVPAYRQISGFRNILYVNPENGKGFVAKINRFKTLGGLFNGFFSGIYLLFSYGPVRSRMRHALPYLTSESMWHQILNLKDKD
ncbi:glycosyltransferase [Leuconostoc holzapfelii]|uniref:Glycosyltransferase family 2 protein n=1 Tax=Leuconostoc holzapfelii TaxID=434464 RepID=A0A846ZGQ1_9LACO|nr:glycosyltransferase [Leuconostoc holzapfelii]NKZ18989.1 glycosyltransferase family 2 protein [Leuconostoc holzapfelii]